MLSILSRRMRRKAAVFSVVLCALTVLAPHIALALSGPGGYVHCLTQTKPAHAHSAVAVHHHVDDAAHSHAGQDVVPDADDSQGPVAACCGLFAIAGMITETRMLLPAPRLVSQILPFPLSGVIGQGPGRIIRPPIV